MARLHLIESRYDIDVARALVEELQRLGHVVSWDLNYLIPGMEWKQSLKEAVLSCDGLVALLSAHSVTPAAVVSSQWMAADIGAARAHGKFVIPVILGQDGVLPELVSDIFSIFEKDTSRIKEIVLKIDDALQKLMDKKAKESQLNLPAGYQHLASAILRFQQDTPYDKSVFVMMKFPDPNTLETKHITLLNDIWDELVQILSTYGLTARRADKKTYHEQLWENICVYMLGCRYGIAILEDRVAQELNPNVALEYGFMKANNANVGLLRDINFKHDRADLTGKLSKSFVIDDQFKLNKDTLAQAVKDWLLDLGIPPILRR